jgi:hypothetical protein
MMVLSLIFIFVGVASADVPELQGTVPVEATRWVMPVGEGTLTPVPVQRGDGALAPGACQVVARPQAPRQVTVQAHDARTAVAQYHAPGVLDPQESDDGALVQVPARDVQQWRQQADWQSPRVALLGLAFVGLVLFGFLRLWQMFREARA